MKPRPQNWGRLATPVLGSRILLFLGSIPRFPDCYTQATLAHRQALNVERSITENHDLRGQLSCGSDQHERNVHRGGPHTRSQNCLDFSTPDLESRKLANMCTVQERLGLLGLAENQAPKNNLETKQVGLMWPQTHTVLLCCDTFVACCGLTWPENHTFVACCGRRGLKNTRLWPVVA